MSKSALYERLLNSIDEVRPPEPEPEPPVIHVPASPEIERMEEHLTEYVRMAWRIVEPSTVYKHNWHIDAICEHLEAVLAGQIRNLLINMPPRFMKSLCVSVFWPTWTWIKWPELRWLFSAYAESLSVRDSLKCRRIIQSPWYQRNWGDIYQLTGDQNVKSRFENTRTGYRLSTSVESANTGEGGNLVICDDPHNVKEALSAAKREAALVWWDEVMSTRLNDPKTGAKVIIMQRVHEQDLSGHVLEQGGYEHLCLPMEYEPDKKVVTCIGWEDPRSQPDELLWPERMGSAEVADAKKRLGSYGYAGQMQQRPAPAEGGMFKRYWWRYWQYPGQNLPPVIVRMADGALFECPVMTLPDKFDETLQSWDMAFKKTTDTDFVVGQVWGRKVADKFLLDQDRDRMNFPATIAAVRALSAKWPDVMAKLVEDKANGPAVIDTLTHDIPGMIPVEPMGSKEARAAAVSPQVEAGNVYLPHPVNKVWVDDFVNEHAAFPNGANDDQVDGMSQALLRFGARTPEARIRQL